MKRKLKLKFEFKIALITIPFLVLCIFVLNKVDGRFVESCMRNGYSKAYCERSK